MFDNLFGGLFDFNRDGETDSIEAGIGFAIMQDLIENDEEEIRGAVGPHIGELPGLAEIGKAPQAETCGASFTGLRARPRSRRP